MAPAPCPSCATENPGGARFCMACGHALGRTCEACGAEAPPTARFCMTCGAALTGVEPAVHQQPDGRDEPPPEERRQVTVLFADLSGYTAVAERMDPETVKSLVERALRRLGADVERFGGTVDKYIGDNVMAIFGAPTAHEDDAERAVRAAFAMQEAMDEIATWLPDDVSFALRIGINTGEVLAGAIGRDYTVMGDTVNVAARLQSAGRPGAITVGGRTVGVTCDAIEYRELEPLDLRGKAEPVPAWEAVGLIAQHAMRRAASAETALIGRDPELAQLEQLYQRVVRDRQAHIVTLIGEAGVGKTRLLREFETRLERADQPVTVHTGRCLPYGTGIVYWALSEVMRAEAGIVDNDSSDTAWQKLEGYVTSLIGPDVEGDPPARRAALIGGSLGLEVPPELSPTELDPARRRDALLSALRSVVESSAQRRPLVLVFEDIHWADDGMLDAIDHLAQWVRAPLLVTCLARAELLERRPDWSSGRRGASQVFLDPLGLDHTRELAVALLGVHGAELAPLVAERSGGNPLFAEEMARRLAQGGVAAAAELPDTVQAVLAARLDALEPFERRLVQHAAVAGRTFWEGCLAGIAAEEGRDMGRALASLQEKDVLAPGAETRIAGERELAFRHVLIRDVAYAMLPKVVRCRKHYEIGRYIEDRAGDRADELVALLAEHYGRAAALGAESGVERRELGDITDRGVRFLVKAGDTAALLYANPEALSHYRHAIELLGEGPSGSPQAAVIGEKQGDVALRLGRVDAAIEVWGECLDFHRREEDLDRVADLHRKLGAALAVKGERKAAIENYQRGINLLKGGAPRLELVRLYEEAAWLYLQTGDNMLAIYASEKALQLAERLGETSAASRAHGIFGRVFGRIGDTEKARSNLERSVELARGADHGETILALLALGRHLEVSEADARAAGEAYREALELAEQVGDLPAQVELHSAIAQLSAYRAEWDQVERSTAASADLAEREGLVSKLCLPQSLRGILRWRAGDLDGAERYFREAQELADRVGWSELAFEALEGLALTLRDRSDYVGAIDALESAVEVCERAGLMAQAIQATALRAVILMLAGRLDEARAAASEATDLAAKLHYPLGSAAALEARGATAASPLDGADTLAQAVEAWQRLERPLEAARAQLLAGVCLREADPERAAQLLETAAAEFERLDVMHLAERARSVEVGPAATA